jgi:short-subunit dehydrogenase
MVGRSYERLCSVAKEIEIEVGRSPAIIIADLATKESPAEIVAELERLGIRPAFVVNNAGCGLFGLLETADVHQQTSIIDINCRALTELTIRLLPAAKSARGGILNVASVGGFLPGPGMAVYFATKAYVISFTAALREEMALHGLRVTTLCPGPSPTRFQLRARMIPWRRPRLISMDAEEIAASGYSALMRNQPLVIPGTFNFILVGLGSLIFYRLMAFLVRRFHLRSAGFSAPHLPSIVDTPATQQSREGRRWLGF